MALEIAENAIRTSRLWTTRRAELEALAREEAIPDSRKRDEGRLDPDLRDQNALGGRLRGG
jgi:hypothetical protein